MQVIIFDWVKLREFTGKTTNKEYILFIIS